MCGRFTRSQDTSQIVARFDVQSAMLEADARYNIAPTQPVAVVVTEAATHERILDSFQWGLVPHWAKDPSIGSKMINARSETVAEKPAFRAALKQRRCILPASGFYEWQKQGPEGKVRQPFFFHRKDGELFGFAGLWEQWDSPDGSPLLTCTILTTTANETVAPVHERMPVILSTPEDESLWLDDTMTQTDRLLPLLKPYPDEWMEAYPVSRRVNSPAMDMPELLEAVG